MRSTGNSTPEVCVNNLLRMVRGEVPYERVKGLNPRLVDRPSAVAAVDLEQDAEWLIGTYEPRVTFDGISVEPPEAADGSPTITAKITETEE